MEENYDVIVLGTGLTECILSGLLSIDGKKVLHIDRQEYYGGESASLNLTQLYSKFKPSKPYQGQFGKDRDWLIDLIPKFLMSNGELTNILVHTDVTRYMEFKQVSGSFVYRDGRIAKVPATTVEAISSPLMGFFEKRRMSNFLQFIVDYTEDDISTHHSIDLDKQTMHEIYTHYGLQKGTCDFIGHAMALHHNDDYLIKPARDTYDRIILYLTSVARYGKSPYIYPLYGLGELPQGFARLSAIYGGTFMLDTPIDELLWNGQGQFVGVKTKEGVAKAPICIADPTYFPEKVTATGQKVIRAMCILDHPIPNTGDADSAQIIIPQNQVGRKNDIYIAVISSAHNICAKGYYVAIISTIIETTKPHLELEPAFKVIGPTKDVLMGIAEIYRPIEDGSKDHVYISKSYDPSSHFESTTDDVKEIYERVTGHSLVLKQRKTAEEEADLAGLD
ncbi:Rab GDP dissociation inhibitor alpha [Brettanomyces nanus]|uniref:Rab GDP dissociation inhibitor n=1 Tax=Eeniella nana TaxID=13502 RepID=A0A875SDS7_EENNA|nr:Rab GDP dissociation inhibitor alpha [Brettanomyces nanus]QPG76834.1 Rab GDP dissociation inhibitor alpha [Brettanomyces nanus]